MTAIEDPNKRYTVAQRLALGFPVAAEDAAPVRDNSKQDEPLPKVDPRTSGAIPEGQQYVKRFRAELDDSDRVAAEIVEAGLVTADSIAAASVGRGNSFDGVRAELLRHHGPALARLSAEQQHAVVLRVPRLLDERARAAPAAAAPSPTPATSPERARAQIEAHAESLRDNLEEAKEAQKEARRAVQAAADEVAKKDCSKTRDLYRARFEAYDVAAAKVRTAKAALIDERLAARASDVDRLAELVTQCGPDALNERTTERRKRLAVLGQAIAAEWNGALDDLRGAESVATSAVLLAESLGLPRDLVTGGARRHFDRVDIVRIVSEGIISGLGALSPYDLAEGLRDHAQAPRVPVVGANFRFGSADVALKARD